jgi:hypothetical protein
MSTTSFLQQLDPESKNIKQKKNLNNDARRQTVIIY